MQPVTRLHPFDFDALRKGTWISNDELQSAAGCKPSDGDRWRFAVLGLVSEIREQCGILAREDHGRLRLMTDAEADEWNFRQGKMGLSKLARSAARTALIDHSQLTAEEQAISEHRSRLLYGATSAARKALRKEERAKALAASLISASEEGPKTDDEPPRP